MGKIFSFILIFMAGLAVPALAADAVDYVPFKRTSLASDWVVSHYASTRLVSAQASVGPDSSQILLGFQVDLQPGWKTYWRSPGEAGVPPRWNWRKATNVSDINVEWPLPKRSSHFGIESLVYEHQVVMPITLKLKQPGKAVALDLMVDYFVCENICVPLQGHYKLNIPASATAAKPTREAVLISDFAKRVPLQAGLRDAVMGDGVKISGLRLAKSGENSTIHFDAVGGKSMNNADVFVEGPKDLGFGTPRRSGGKSGAPMHFEVPVYGDGLNVAEVLAGSLLVLTVTDDDGNASEYHLQVK